MRKDLRRNQIRQPVTLSKSGLTKARALAASTVAAIEPYQYPIKPPSIAPGVLPNGVKEAPVCAMDANPAYTPWFQQQASGAGFPGFQYLSQLATRAEYRALASAMSTELTREWITFTSKQDDGSQDNEKIKRIEEEFRKLNVRGVFQQAAEMDCYFGRGQIFVNVNGADNAAPLILHPSTVRKGSLKSITSVEAVWTTPDAYNALNPSAPDFYKPTSWFMLGQQVHASRLLTVVTRALPDILKPAYNFAGMSLSQLAEPYVDNWLRTRQSVADLINNFSITVLKTSMAQVLQGTDDGQSIFDRADLFTLTRSNKGLMLLDKEEEELQQLNVPLSGLHELQAQAQEHMCSVSRIPAMILTGISPSGLNASSEGEIRVFYDWIAAQQEAFWRDPLTVILKVVQLSLFGEIDPDIDFVWNPLYQMTPEQLSAIRFQNMQTDTGYITAAVLAPEDVQARLAKDENSGYVGIEVAEVTLPAHDPGAESDPTGSLPVAADEFREQDHPCAENGQFGSGGGGAASSKKGEKKSKPAPKSAEGYTDENGNERSPGLSDSERKIESDFYAAVDKHGPELISEYRELNGNVIDPDLVKQLNPEFKNNPDLAAAVHEPSSKLAKMIYSDALERKAAAGDTSPTVFTAGGSGSGKSTTMADALEKLGAKSDGLLYDSVLSSPKSAKSRIDQALKVTDGDVGIAYTNADIKTALMFNALRKRSVSIDTLMHAHVGASNTLRDLAEHYKDNPRVKIVVMNNLGDLSDIAEGSIADVPKYQPQELRRQLVDVAKGMLDSGAITKEKYNLLVK